MKTLKTIIIAISITLLLIITCTIVVPALLGYKITYLTSVKYNYNAIGAYASWVGALLPILLVFLSVYVSHQFEKEKREISDSNIATVEYVKDMIDELKNTSNISAGNDMSSEMKFSILKEKALKYVNISGITKTEAVSKHLGISKEEAFDILNELLKHDRAISAGGQTVKTNIDGVIWTRKR
ncbi:MAG: hypothetical protein JEZ08_17625 [Clostridiales bacterium]|nr:hypothetical protein [Clostridiales bacterium]